MASTSAQSERASRHREDANLYFKEAAKFMPLLVMTLDQASEILPADHSFDLVISDESSQSNYTAINIMARSKQFLAVGDEKQVSPTHVCLAEERIRWLTTRLPDIPTAKQLLPERSFFTLFKSAFPLNSVCMLEHFRCDPRIIAISNESFYDKALVPLRLATQTRALEDCFVGGKKRIRPRE